MQIRTSLLATTALVALTLAAPAANAAGSGWYVSLSGGANWVDDSSFALVNTVPSTTTFTLATNADTGWVVAGAIGYSLSGVMPGLRVEAEVGYRENQIDGTFLTSITAGPTTDSGPVDADHQTFSVLANVWYDFDVGGFKPYLGGGIGWAETEFEGTYIGTVSLVNTPFSFEDSGFAWQVGAGINFDISPNVMLGIGYRYFSGPEVTILPPVVAPNILAGDIESDNHSAALTLTFVM
jgi:opacity protein-like surface antigen